MVTPVNDLTRETKSGTAGRSGGAGNQTDESTLAELRKSVNALADEFAQITEKRGRQVKEQAEAGVSVVRTTIRRQPALAMGCAVLAGAVLAILIVPRQSLPSTSTRRAGARWDGWMPSITRADLYEAMDSVQRSVSRAANATPLAGTFERLLEAITKVDPQASLGSTIEKAGSWLERMQSKVKK